MDKNMIKIDDLLRQRLDGAEEQERAGAWSNMRDLLDKQMPVSAIPASTNWRRMFAYVAGVVLLAAVSVGGYEMIHSFESDGGAIADNSNTSGTKHTAPTTGLAGTAINSLPETTGTEQSTPAPATDVANNTIATAQPVKQAGNSVAQHTAEPVAKKQTVTKAATNNTAVPNTFAANTEVTKAAPVTTPAKNVVGNTTANTTDVAKKAPTANANTANNTKAADNNLNNTPANNNKAQGINNTAKTNTDNKKSNTKETAPEKMGTSKMDNNPVAVNTPEPKYEEVPVQKTVRRETIGPDGKPLMDTIFNGEDVMKRELPKKDALALAKNKADDDNSGSNMMPASAAPAAKKDAVEEDAHLERLGDHLTDRKKIKNFNPSRFEEMVQNAKFRMGSVKFYPGIVAGANASFNGNYGAQAGLAGNLTVSERWAILTEVKFAYVFNNKHVNMQDDYIDNVKPTVINNQAVYKYDSIDHHFNFNSYMNIEVPLMVTYTKNKYVFMLGADFRYNFGITAIQEVKEKYLSEKPYYSTSEPTFETDEQILLSDFGSKMNVGPILGVGYQFKPGFRLDCRVSKSLWNSAKSIGQKEVSKGLYDMPQLQLNMTWKISSNKPYKKKK